MGYKIKDNVFEILSETSNADILIPFYESVTAFTNRYIAPINMNSWHQGSFPAELWPLLGKQELLGIQCLKNMVV